MKLVGKSEPWEHYLVENFIPDDSFPSLQNWVKSLPKTPPDKRRNSAWIIPSGESNDDYIVNPKMYDLLTNRFKLILGDDYDPDTMIIICEYNTCPAGYQYPIHNDAPEKIASMVLYVSEEGDGTVLYNRDETYHSRQEWKPNTGFFFFRKEDTWHSYHSTVENRDTINCILVEKDSELLSNIRYNINV